MVRGMFPSREAHASKLVVKLIVPDVRIPGVLYSSCRVSSHSLANGLSGLAVMASLLAAMPFAFLASSTFAFVRPLAETITRVFPLVLRLFVNDSYLNQSLPNGQTIVSHFIAANASVFDRIVS